MTVRRMAWCAYAGAHLDRRHVHADWHFLLHGVGVRSLVVSSARRAARPHEDRRASHAHSCSSDCSRDLHVRQQAFLSGVHCGRVWRGSRVGARVCRRHTQSLCARLLQPATSLGNHAVHGAIQSTGACLSMLYLFFFFTVHFYGSKRRLGRGGGGS